MRIHFSPDRRRSDKSCAGFVQQEIYFCKYDVNKRLLVTTTNEGPLSRGAGKIVTTIRTQHTLAREPFIGIERTILHASRDRITETAIAACHEAVVSIEMIRILKEVNKFYEDL